MIVPFATITNKNDEYTLETISKNEYLSGEEFLLNHYIKIRERISTESNKSISNGLKKKGGV
jgi:hypothetical protein